MPRHSGPLLFVPRDDFAVERDVRFVEHLPIVQQFDYHTGGLKRARYSRLPSMASLHARLARFYLGLSNGTT